MSDPAPGLYYGQLAIKDQDPGDSTIERIQLLPYHNLN
jgi:hypothetical protein